MEGEFIIWGWYTSTSQSQKLRSSTEGCGSMDYIFRVVICSMFVLWRLLGYELGKWEHMAHVSSKSVVDFTILGVMYCLELTETSGCGDM